MYLDDDDRVRRGALISLAAVVVALGVFGYWLLLGRPLPNVPGGAESPASPPSAAAPVGTTARGAADTDGTPAGTASADAPAAAPAADATSADAAADAPAEHRRGEPIALISRPGVLLTVKSIEWHDRMQVQVGDGARYVNPAMGGFLVVVFEIANQTTGAIAPAEVSMPVLEDDAGARYQRSPLRGIVASGQQAVDASGSESIAPGGTATRVEFFDVPLEFVGALHSEVDRYRVPVGQAR